MELLEKKRKKLGLNKSEMADYLGISKSLYCLYMQGKRFITIEKAQKFSKILKVKANKILKI